MTLDIEHSGSSVTAATQVICAVVFPGRTTVTGYRERALGRFVIRLCVTAAGGLIRTRFNSSVSRFDLIGVMHGRPPGHYASFRRNIAHVGRRQDRKVRANSGTRFEPENSCVNRLRTSASGAPVRSHNEAIARSCLTASLPGSKSEFIEPPTVKIGAHAKAEPCG